MSTTTTMTRTKSTMTTLAVLLLSLTMVSAGNECNICGDAGMDGIKYPNVVIPGTGKTCPAIALDVAVALPNHANSQQCRNKQAQWSMCCDPDNPPDGETYDAAGVACSNYVEKSQRVWSVDQGRDPCNLCRDGEFPGVTSMVINFLYIGVGTCEQYYEWGRQGKIETFMCDPIKFFAHEPCGCGEFNPMAQCMGSSNQAPETNNGNNGNNNSGNNNNGNNNAAEESERKSPDSLSNQGKESMSMNGSMGGSGGGNRRLKGATRGATLEMAA